MRVTFIIPYFYPAWQYGGTPRAAFELARALTRRNHAVQVLTTDSGGDCRLQLENLSAGWKEDLAGIDVVYYRNNSNTLAYKYRFFWPSQFFKEMRTRLLKSDVVHIHEFRSTLSVPAFYALRSLQIPYVVSPHGGLRRLGKAVLKTGFDAFFGNRILLGAAAVVGVSDVEVADARDFNVEDSRVHCIPNPVDVNLYTNLPQAGEFRKRWGLADHPFVLFLGRLHWIKGADLLLRAVSKIPANIRLVIAGPDDGQEQELRRLASDLRLESRVLFTGFQDAQEKLRAFVDCDLVVVPSRSEVFSITALEGLICQKPVLLSSVCGLAASLQRFGVVRFESGNDLDLADKIRLMLNDKSFTERAQNAYKFIAREFSPEAVAVQTEELYKACVQDFQHAS